MDKTLTYVIKFGIMLCNNIQSAVGFRKLFWKLLDNRFVN